MTSTEQERKQATPPRRPAQDGRGRYFSAPALLHYGFRPFFLLAALHAALALPVWLIAYATGADQIGPFPGMHWHAHEMLFGFLGAVIAGFLLTAIPNWTGRLPLSGSPLAVLVIFWLIGRFACALVANAPLALVLDLLFPAAFLAAILREILAGKNWRNLPVAGVFGLFVLANLLHHLEVAAILQFEFGLRLALGAAAMMIALIGGRITPSFTRNWLVKRGATALPAKFGRMDRTALVITAVAVLSWAILPFSPIAGTLLILAGLLLFARLVRWRGWATLPEPILLILHLGYAWLAAALALIGLSILLPGAFPASAGYHALSAGAIGTMTLAVMTRASLGHTGHEIRADAWTRLLYLFVILGALVRVAAPWLAGDHYVGWLVTGGLAWSLAFALFAARYGPMLASRQKNRHGA